MDRSSLSSRDLSKLLDINVSTVKRWADSGLLPCFKTPGGHRRFRLEDIQGFLVERGVNPRTLDPFIIAEDWQQRLEEAILNRHWNWLRDHLVSLATTGQTASVVRVFSAMYLTGVHPAELCDNVISPALVHIGHQWATNRLTVVDEHLATHTIHSAFDQMSSRWPPQRSCDYTAICVCFSNNEHDLPCHFVSQVLRHEGWKASVIGANTPTESIITAIEKHRPDLIAVSATIIPDMVAFTSDSLRVANAAREHGGTLAVGGNAVFAQNYSPPDESIVLLRDMNALVEMVREKFPVSKERCREIDGNDAAEESNGETPTGT